MKLLKYEDFKLIEIKKMNKLINIFYCTEYSRSKNAVLNKFPKSIIYNFVVEYNLWRSYSLVSCLKI